MRLLSNHGFFGLLLMHMRFAIDEELDTACTDGEKISFGPEFLDDLSDSELDFVMMHEVMHVALKHCFRGKEYDNFLFNIACDIVVNSNILLENRMHTRSISLKKYGESMHLAPDGKEGYEYSAEEVYSMLAPQKMKSSSYIGKCEMDDECGSEKGKGKGGKSTQNGSKSSQNSGWDDHSQWGKEQDDSSLSDAWSKRLKDAAEAIEIRNASNTRGEIPLLAERMLKQMRRPSTDWRTVLNEFVQEEITDYSFSPPDKRFDGGDFFLPDFNEKDEIVEDVLFMIDTSGSMSDDMICAAFSEIYGAIEQFGGKLRGWLGFFDAVVVPPVPFMNENEFKTIRPKGGGGTSFHAIFNYLDKMEKLPVSIIILTDGCAPYPDESAAKGIPVLWLLNNEKLTPPWGKITRIKI